MQAASPAALGVPPISLRFSDQPSPKQSTSVAGESPSSSPIELLPPYRNEIFLEKRLTFAQLAMVDSKVNFIMVFRKPVHDHKTPSEGSPKGPLETKQITLISADKILNEAGLEPILKALEQCEVTFLFLRELTFVGGEAAQRIADSLKAPAQILEELRFDHCGIPRKGYQSICEGLLVNRSVKLLEISNTRMGNDVIKNLMPVLRINDVINGLVLTNNNIDEDGFRELSEIVAKYTNLKALILGKNCPGNEGVIMLLQALKVNKGLKTLILRFSDCPENVPIGDKVAEAAADFFRTKKSGDLAELSLTHNIMTDKGITEICHAACEYDGLEFLALNGNNATEATMTKLCLRLNMLRDKLNFVLASRPEFYHFRPGCKYESMYKKHPLSCSPYADFSTPRSPRPSSEANSPHSPLGQIGFTQGSPKTPSRRSLNGEEQPSGSSSPSHMRPKSPTANPHVSKLRLLGTSSRSLSPSVLRVESGHSDSPSKRRDDPKPISRENSKKFDSKDDLKKDDLKKDDSKDKKDSKEKQDHKSG